MAKRFKITESQYRRLMEGVKPVTVKAPELPGDRGKTDYNALAKQTEPLEKAGVTYNVEKTGTADTNKSATTSSVSEQKRRKRRLRENSEVLSFNNFIKRLR